MSVSMPVLANIYLSLDWICPSASYDDSCVQRDSDLWHPSFRAGSGRAPLQPAAQAHQHTGRSTSLSEPHAGRQINGPEVDRTLTDGHESAESVLEGAAVRAAPPSAGTPRASEGGADPKREEREKVEGGRKTSSTWREDEKLAFMDTYKVCSPGTSSSPATTDIHTTPSVDISIVLEMGPLDAQRGLKVVADLLPCPQVALGGSFKASRSPQLRTCSAARRPHRASRSPQAARTSSAVWRHHPSSQAISNHTKAT